MSNILEDLWLAVRETPFNKQSGFMDESEDVNDDRGRLFGIFRNISADSKSTRLLGLTLGSVALDRVYSIEEAGRKNGWPVPKRGTAEWLAMLIGAAVADHIRWSPEHDEQKAFQEDRPEDDGLDPEDWRGDEHPEQG